jgi:hypothetical protein
MNKESTIRFPAAVVRGTKIVTALIFFFGLQFSARADLAYMSSDGGFGTIDLTTGIYTQTSTTNVGATTVDLAGLGEINNTLYGVPYAEFPGTLYTIDPSSGSLTAVGPPGTNSGDEFSAFGSTLTGLYAIGAGDLYSINSTTGVATDIGATGLSLGGDYSLSTNSSILYFADDSPPGDAPSLYTLNTSTGAATLLGTTGDAEFGALLLDGSTLYGGRSNFPAAQLDTLSTSDGSVTAGPLLTGTTEGFGGLAPIPAPTAVPEPSSFSLLLLGGLSAGILIIQKRRRTAADPD